MARVIYGSIITDIKGSIGGITYQKNGSGTIARLKPRKTKTNTQKQRDQQPRLKELQRNWNLLELGLKALWNDFASVNDKIGLDGNPKVLTGYQWYLSINQNRLLFNDPILEAPPVFEVVNPIQSVVLEFPSNDDLILRSNISGLVGSRICVYSSFALNSASKFDFNKCRLLYAGINQFGNAIQINTRPSNPAWDNYYNDFFPPQLGNKSFYLTAYVRFIGSDSGISSLAYTTISRFVWDGVKYVIE